MSISIGPKSAFQKPPTRNQRFLAALARNHSKIKSGSPASNLKRSLKRIERHFDIQLDPDRLELLSWITEVQAKLKLSDAEFGRLIRVSQRMLQYYRAGTGYLPSKRVFRKLLEAEKLTRISVVVKRDKLILFKIVPMHHVIIA